MTEIRIRNVDDWIVDQHRFNAKRMGTSLEQELKRVLSEGAFAKQHRIADEIDRHLESVETKFGNLPSCTGFIRDLRDGNVRSSSTPM
ncbi:MAG: hypothetical protein U0930_23480 [Pirellulales bacterium]